MATRQQDDPLFDLERSYIVGASAGTGKTYTLTGRYFNLLRFKKARPEQILTVTFTEKAAAEMLERIRELVEQERNNSDRSYWQSILNQLPFAQISTIHSWCARVLRRYALHLTLNPTFQIMEADLASIYLQKCIDDFLEAELDQANEDLIITLEELDYFGIKEFLARCTDKKIMLQTINSHPRSDKKTTYDKFTELISFYLEWLMQNFQLKELFVELSRIRPKKENLEDNLVYLRHELLKLFSINPPYISNPEQFIELLDSINLQKGKAQFWEDTKTKKKVCKTIGLIRKILRFDHHVLSSVDPHLEENQARLSSSLFRLAIKFLEFYTSRLYDESLLDFHSLESETLRLMNTMPEQWREYARSIRYLLVDEFQDINPDQFALLDGLLEANPDINFLFVGDEKQSIFGFRQADVEIFNRLRKRGYRSAVIYSLKFNYRSLPPLVDFQNHLFSFIMGNQPHPYDFSTHYAEEIQAVRKDPLKLKRIYLIKPEADEEWSRILVESRKKEPRFRVEFLALVNTIKLIHNQWELLEEEGNTRKVSYRDIAILTRDKNYLTILEDYLKSNGIPYQSKISGSIYESREVLDILNYLKILYNPDDDLSLVAILRSPFALISDFTLYQISQHLKDNSWFQIIQQDALLQEIGIAADERERIQEFLQTYHELKARLPGSTISQFLFQLLEKTGYPYILRGKTIEDRLFLNLERLLELAHSFQQTGHGDLYDFLQIAENLATLRGGETETEMEAEDAVQLLTIHTAKGLQFPVVFLVKSDDRKRTNAETLLLDEKEGVALKISMELTEYYYPIPYRRSYFLKKIKALEEEKRLLYVALSRARDYLFITLPPECQLQAREGINTNPTYLDYIREWYQEFPDTFNQFVEFIPVEVTSADGTPPEPAPDESLEKTLAETLERVAVNQKRKYHRIHKIVPSQVLHYFREAEEGKKAELPSISAGRLIKTADSPPADLQGTIIHRLIQRFFNLNFNLEQAFQETLREFPILQSKLSFWQEQIGTWITELQKQLQPYYQEASSFSTELGFSLQHNSLLMEGVIDLVLFFPDKILFLDWKTDSVKSISACENRYEHYRPQLLLYAAALSHLYPEKPIQGGIYFLQAGWMKTETFLPDTIKIFLNDLHQRVTSPGDLSCSPNQMLE